MIGTLLRRSLAIVALPVELVSVLLTGAECGFGNWTLDRKPGDASGKLLQTRAEAEADAERKRRAK